MNPGSTILPAKSFTLVLTSTSALMDWLEPTARISLPLIAIASAQAVFHRLYILLRLHTHCLPCLPAFALSLQVLILRLAR